MKRLAFTLIEMLIVVVIISILATAVAFGYVTHVRNARCARIKQDFDAISKALEVYYEVNQTWPAESSSGVEPTGLVPQYLSAWPTGDFYKEGYKYDYQNWNSGGQAIAIVLRSGGGVAVSYYCIKDDSGANCKGNKTMTGEEPLNNGGNCPKSVL